jgi:hypothetical protein
VKREDLISRFGHKLCTLGTAIESIFFRYKERGMQRVIFVGSRKQPIFPPRSYLIAEYLRVEIWFGIWD